jgi:hypothetical protein
MIFSIMPAPEVLSRGDQETAGAGRRIADDVRRRGLRKLNHKCNYVPRRAELTVLACRRDLAEHVLVDITLGVPIIHADGVELLGRLREQRRRRNAETWVLHVLTESRALAAERTQEREDALVDDSEHLARLERLEARPPEILVGPATLVFPLSE